MKGIGRPIRAATVRERLAHEHDSRATSARPSPNRQAVSHSSCLRSRVMLGVRTRVRGPAALAAADGGSDFGVVPRLDHVVRPVATTSTGGTRSPGRIRTGITPRGCSCCGDDHGEDKKKARRPTLDWIGPALHSLAVPLGQVAKGSWGARPPVSRTLARCRV